jgi:hypothetical protein
MTRQRLLRALGALALLLGMLEVADGFGHVERLTFLLRAEPVLGITSVLGGWGLILLLPWSRRLLLTIAPIQIALAVWNGFAGNTVDEAGPAVAVVTVVLQLALIVVLRHRFAPVPLLPSTR